MTKHDVMKAFQASGTAQNRKVYMRHGIGENMFGVSFMELKKLTRQIKIDYTYHRFIFVRLQILKFQFQHLNPLFFR
jgi:hypothetical protein